MRVALLTGDPGSASARVRLEDPLPGLRAAGIEAAIVALPRGWLARRRALRALRAFDLVVLHRRLLDRVLLGTLRRAAGGLLLDLDDAIWTRPGGRSRRLEARFERALRAADLVVVGSGWLEAQLAPRHPRVRLLPPVPPPAPPFEPIPPDGRVHLAWTGSRATLPYLESIGPALAALARERSGWVLDVVADAAPALPPGVPVALHPWSLAREAAVLAGAQVGLHPLPDDPWTRGKCAYKVRLYLRHGLAVATVPHGGGAEAAGTAGVLIEDPAGWAPVLARLLSDRELCATLGARGRELASQRDDPARRDRALAAILREVVATPGFTARQEVC